jgi:hypothetical protein
MSDTQFETVESATEAYLAGGKTRIDVTNQATAECAAMKAAAKAGQPVPATPALDAVKAASEAGVKPAKSNGKAKGDGAPRTKFDDAALAELVKVTVEAGHARTIGGVVKYLRDNGKGSNGKRVAAAFAEALKAGMKVPEAPAKKAAAPRKAAAKKTTAAKKAAPAKRASAATKAPAKKAAGRPVNTNFKGQAQPRQRADRKAS